MDLYSKLGLDRPSHVPPPSSQKDDLTEITVNIDEVQANCKEHLDFLASLAMPATYQYAYPPVFLAVWSWLTEYSHKVRDFSQLALGLPRGFGKSTVIKLFLLYIILFTTKKFILVCAETEKKAINIVSDVMSMLSEPNIRKVFGDWKVGEEIDQQAHKVFGFRGRTITIVAGTVKTARGLNVKNERPDVILMDDVQSKEMSRSEQVSQELEEEIQATTMKAKSPHGCLFIFVANMYPTTTSILRKLKYNPTWIKFIAGGILEDGSSLWEDLQPIIQLEKEYLNDLSMGHPEIFFAEVLNDENAKVNNNLDLSKVPAFDISPGDIPSGKGIIIDPATDKANADAVTVAYFEIHNGLPAFLEIKEGRMSPLDTIWCALRMAMEHNCRAIGIESNAYQYSLLFWFNYVIQQAGMTGFYCLELYSGHTAKQQRILKMFLQYVKGEIKVHPTYRPLFNSQAVAFQPLKTNNTDGVLDCVTYAPKMMELYPAELAASMEIIEQEAATEGVQENNSSF